MKPFVVMLPFITISIIAFAQESTTPPPRVYPVALPNYDEETATRLQIFLDNSDFTPGKIDGRMGEFFRKALISSSTHTPCQRLARSIPGCSIKCR